VTSLTGLGSLTPLLTWDLRPFGGLWAGSADICRRSAAGVFCLARLGIKVKSSGQECPLHMIETDRNFFLHV